MLLRNLSYCPTLEQAVERCVPHYVGVDLQRPIALGDRFF
jgi:hypothetical protein